MGYYVIMRDVEQMENAIQNKTTEWNHQLDQVYSALSAYTECMETKAAGETAEAVCAYMKEIHQYLLDRFYRLFIEVSSRALVYAEGYYKIEDDRNRGEIAQESLEEQIQMLAENQGKFESIASDLETAISSINSIIGIAAPSTQNVCDGFQSTSKVANDFMDEVGTYEFAHAANDFAIMEGMMDSIESLIREYSGKAPAEVEKYQAGSILTSEEVIALMEIEKVQTAWFAENGEDLRKAAEAYQNRINAALREEAGRQRFIKGVMIAAAAVVSAVVIVGSGGSATPAVAALWNAGVVTLAGTSAIYGVSEASEGLDDIRLGQAGDCVTVARNPVRDALPEDMQNIYYIAGEGSTIALALCTLGVGAVEIYGVSGMTGVVVEGGKIIVTAAGTHLIGEGLEELGMERSSVMLLEIGISVAIYGSLNKMQSAVENQQHVMVEVGSEGGRQTATTIDYSYKFDRELANFNDGYEIRTTVDKDLILVQYSSDAPDASLCYWTTVDEANGITTLNDYMDKLALSKDWGNRNTVKVARIPVGTEVKYAVGTAREQLLIADPRPGGGVQYLFSQFDTDWITEIRSFSN